MSQTQWVCIAGLCMLLLWAMNLWRTERIRGELLRELLVAKGEILALHKIVASVIFSQGTLRDCFQDMEREKDVPPTKAPLSDHIRAVGRRQSERAARRQSEGQRRDAQEESLQTQVGEQAGSQTQSVLGGSQRSGSDQKSAFEMDLSEPQPIPAYFAHGKWIFGEKPLDAQVSGDSAAAVVRANPPSEE